MSKTLASQMVPHSHVLKHIFQDAPALKDVALYFAPGRVLQERCASLVQLMLKEESMLRCKTKVPDMELLVFTSKQLNEASRDVIESYNGGTLLCGVFYRTRNNITTS